MEEKYPINKRIRDIMAVFGYSDNVNGFYMKYLEGDNSERLRLVFTDKYPIKLDFLTEITNSIGTKESRKINGHWLLFGEGSMFLEEKGTGDTNNDEAAISRKINQLTFDLAKAQLEIDELKLWKDNVQGTLDKLEKKTAGVAG